MSLVEHLYLTFEYELAATGTQISNSLHERRRSSISVSGRLIGARRDEPPATPESRLVPIGAPMAIKEATMAAAPPIALANRLCERVPIA
jgi:hypothetical protein